MMKSHYRPTNVDGTLNVRRRFLVNELHHVVLIRKGRITRVLEPGLHRMRPRTDLVRVFPAGEQVLIVAGQEVLTSDAATVRATVSVVTEVGDPLLLARRGNYQQAFYLQVQLAVRAAIASRSLEEVLEVRDALDGELTEAVREHVESLGLVLRSVAVRDLVVPGELKRAVTEMLTARLAGQATLERARGETAALRSLANAARLAEQTPTLISLRLLQQMETTTGNTFVIDTQPQRTG